MENIFLNFSLLFFRILVKFSFTAISEQWFIEHLHFSVDTQWWMSWANICRSLAFWGQILIRIRRFTRISSSNHLNISHKDPTLETRKLDQVSWIFLRVEWKGWTLNGWTLRPQIFVGTGRSPQIPCSKLRFIDFRWFCSFSRKSSIWCSF